MRALRERGGRVVEVARMPLVPRRAFSALVLYAAPLARLVQVLRLRVTAARARPDLAILSLGTNVDGTALAAALRRLRLPYVNVAHKAPSSAGRPRPLVRRCAPRIRTPWPPISCRSTTGG